MEERHWRDYTNYIMIAIVSGIALIFLPMISSTLGVGFNWPQTALEWVLYIVKQLLSAIVNILIFHNFVLQARVNVKDDPRYIEAQNILMNYKPKDYIPLSLSQFNKREYGIKGVSIFIGSILATFAISQAVLSYDYALLIAYFITVSFGIVMGILEMHKYERYYVSMYLDYARMIKKQRDEEALEVSEKELDKQADALTDPVG